MSAPRELHHFLLLDHQQQVAAVRRLHALGWSDHAISTATRLHVEQIRRLLAERDDDRRSEATMSAWLLQRPARPGETAPRYLAVVDRTTARTTGLAVLAMRFAGASDARAFAAQYAPRFDDWRVVRR